MAHDEPPLDGLAVASAIPGRIRVRAPRAPDGASLLARLADAVGSRDDVAEVLLRPASRSAIVRCSPRDTAAVRAGLADLGVRAAARDAAPVRRDVTTVAADAAAALDGAVADRMDGHKLRQLLPLGLALMSVRQLLRGSERLGDAPWYVLGWYASELFFRFQLPAGPARGSQPSSGRRPEEDKEE